MAPVMLVSIKAKYSERKLGLHKSRFEDENYDGISISCPPSRLVTLLLNLKVGDRLRDTLSTLLDKELGAKKVRHQIKKGHSFNYVVIFPLYWIH